MMPSLNLGIKSNGISSFEFIINNFINDFQHAAGALPEKAHSHSIRIKLKKESEESGDYISIEHAVVDMWSIAVLHNFHPKLTMFLIIIPT